MPRPALRACALVAGLAVVVLVGAPASAHVTVDSPDAEAGGFGKLVFRVPTESDTASTTKVTVRLPKDTPFAFVSTKTKPGWNVTMDTVKHDEPVKADGFTVTKTVSKITWTAEKGNAIRPGEFDEFALSVGPFPDDPDTDLTFPAVQRYSDGTTVTWNQPTPRSGEEPEHPAPTLTLADPEPAAPSPADTRSSSVLPALALCIAVAALGLAVVACVLVLRRRPSDPARPAS